MSFTQYAKFYRRQIDHCKSKYDDTDDCSQPSGSKFINVLTHLLVAAVVFLVEQLLGDGGGALGLLLRRRHVSHQLRLRANHRHQLAQHPDDVATQTLNQAQIRYRK